ncbi:MAG: thiamine ABC transporter substrate-binding protein [Candidatus Thermoplasmatota archaeon]|nr:thiamine ABC transporter substrate-binding protein [Candidatus Thermoplasmatota archaeon]
MDSRSISGKELTFAISAVVVLVLAVAGSIYVLERLGEDDDADLVIVSYQSFSTWGLGPWAEEEFESLYGLDVRIDTNYGDVGQLLSALEVGGVKADLVIGIDNSMLRTALELDMLSTYKPDNISWVDPQMIFDPSFHVVPYDYGYLAMICNSEMMEDRDLPYPDSIMNLSDDVYRDQLMLIDPTMSSTGSSFLIWAASVAGDDLDDYLDELSRNQFNVYQSWDAMYEFFKKGEAPIAISYGLDTASDIQWAGSSSTVTIVPDDEGYRQIEGAGILKDGENRENAELFLEFMLSDGFQSRVGYNVMLPVIPGTEIDPLYLEHGQFATSHVEPDIGVVLEDYDDWLDCWESSFY